MRGSVKTIGLGFMILWGIFFFCGRLDAAVPGLTPAEQQWLAVHDGSVRLAHTPDWPPMDFLGENGEPMGMAADYIRLIEKKLDFKFKVVRVCSWDEMLDRARSGGIDVISAGQATTARREFMNWSTPYMNLKTTIIVTKKQRGSLTLDQMRGMKIGVVREYAVGEFIREMYPHLTLVDVASSREGMRRVSFGELDAMITEVPNALYIIETEKITNLRLAGDTGFELNHGMGVRRDWPVFSSIIEKTLASITPREHKAIYSKWVKLATPAFYQTRGFWYSVLGIAFVVLLVVGSVLFWNMELQRQVLQRTEALRFNEIGLEALLAINEKTHETIRDLIEYSFRKMLDLTQSSFGYLAMEDQDGITYVVDFSNPASSQKCYIQNQNTGFRGDTKGFWGEAVRSGKPIISNDYPNSNPRLRGVPEVYKHMVRYMNVPIFDHGKIVVVVGMGNKETDYDSSDLRQVNLLAHGMWRLIQRKKAEQAMRKSEKRFQDLVEHSPNGIAIVQNKAVVHKNSIQVELMGNLNFMNPDSDPSFHRDDLQKVKAFYGQIIRDDLKQSEVAFRFYPSDARDSQETMKWVNCIATPMDYQDRKAFLLIFIDMTEAKKLERLLTIQDKMASLGHVSAGIAHEIRNPLSGINIYLRTIEKNYRNPAKSGKIDSSILAVRSASQKIESVIKRVMNFAKPTEPKFDLIRINDPLREAVKLTGFTLKKMGIAIDRELDDRLPDCYAEPHLIEEVILNLINNAADALSQTQTQVQTRDKGMIRVSSRMEKDKILLCVEDNGPGIPGDLEQKIFDPFFTTKEHSTGIGLSLCHRIITDHKGKLDVVRSGLGGAAFLIELPVSHGSGNPQGMQA
ncbi:MAG: transporter substrate-binding domain-containing protein [Desulfobacteraceae bacterium]|nr:transporter substrate-binding domain-containing protein [Desulfobacteraceae bacterium]